MSDDSKRAPAPSLDGFTQEDWDEVSDNPEITAAEWAARRPFAEVFPDLAASFAARTPKKLISLRLDQDVIDGFRATGPGWQSRINAALRDKLAGR